jgi:hypothetical protein
MTGKFGRPVAWNHLLIHIFAGDGGDPVGIERGTLLPRWRFLRDVKA